MNHLAHFSHTPDATERADYQDYLLRLIAEIWAQFAAKIEVLWVNNNQGELMPAAY